MRIGYELECSVKENKFDELTEWCNKKYFGITTDGSIETSRDGALAKELRSRVYDLTELHVLKSDLKQLCEFLYPSNDTMGFHIHVSFEPKEFLGYIVLHDYNALTKLKEAYLEKFKAQREKKRVGSNYCRFTDSEKDFMGYLRREHYCAISSVDSFRRHKTIEFRVFPSSSKDYKLSEYIDFVIDFTKDLISKNTNKSIFEQSKIITDDEAVIKLDINSADDKYNIICPLCGLKRD